MTGSRLCFGSSLRLPAVRPTGQHAPALTHAAQPSDSAYTCTIGQFICLRQMTGRNVPTPTHPLLHTTLAPSQPPVTYAAPAEGAQTHLTGKFQSHAHLVATLEARRMIGLLDNAGHVTAEDLWGSNSIPSGWVDRRLMASSGLALALQILMLESNATAVAGIRSLSSLWKSHLIMWHGQHPAPLLRGNSTVRLCPPAGGQDGGRTLRVA